MLGGKNECAGAPTVEGFRWKAQYVKQDLCPLSKGLLQLDGDPVSQQASSLLGTELSLIPLAPLSTVMLPACVQLIT